MKQQAADRKDDMEASDFGSQSRKVTDSNVLQEFPLKKAATKFS